MVAEHGRIGDGPSAVAEPSEKQDRGAPRERAGGRLWSQLDPVDRAARRPTSRELVAAAVTALVAAALLYGAHVVRGGWYYDDWAIISRAEFGPNGAFDALFSVGYRPGFSLVLWCMFAVAGTGQSAYLAAGVLLVAIECWLFGTALRLLRLRPLAAWSAALLLLVLPSIDATRLWIAAFPITAALCWYLVGVIVATVGLRRDGGAAWHLGAAACFAAAILTYELVAPVVLITALLYLPFTSPRGALWRWGSDVAVAGLVLLYMGTRPEQDRVTSLSPGVLWDRAREVWRSAASSFEAALPLDSVVAGPLGLAVLLTAAVGLGLSAGRRDALAGAARAWAIIGGLGLIFAVAGLAVLVPADPYYVVRPTGIGDRFGAVPSLGEVVLLVSIAFLVATGLAALARRPAWAAPAAVVLLVLTAGSLARDEVRNQDAWASSWDQSQRIMSAVRAAVPADPPDGSLVMTFHHTKNVLPADVPVFTSSWDLNGAVQLEFGNPTLVGQPYGPGVSCSPSGVVLPEDANAGLGRTTATIPYGKVWFVDAPVYKAYRVASANRCTALLAGLGQ